MSNLCQTFYSFEKKSKGVKKMRLIQTTLHNQKALVFNYMPAKLCKRKSGWLIEYYVENPISYSEIKT